MTKNRIKIVYNLIPKNVKNIIDIGAGYEYVEKLIKNGERDIKLHGNDISPNAIKHLNKKFDDFFKLKSVDNMKY
ncbi:hypothetical protein LBMAG33_2020 [Candidatus Levyibacteriota bacterium]|nr:hypothetical protein [Candidatus Levybacteria bacterium]GDX61892.1 hypothetical protein LBMAG33_2020 [Candidatus Levybacteria bacterium]